MIELQVESDASTRKMRCKKETKSFKQPYATPLLSPLIVILSSLNVQKRTNVRIVFELNYSRISLLFDLKL